jgi:hypothetical protein
MVSQGKCGILLPLRKGEVADLQSKDIHYQRIYRAILKLYLEVSPSFASFLRENLSLFSHKLYFGTRK